MSQLRTVSGGVDWAAVRALFPASREQVYLDSATYGPGPTPVVEAVTRCLAAWSSGRGAWRDWERAGERARGGLARLLAIDAGRVALLPAVSLAAAQVAERLPFASGDNIVVGAEEFRSNLYPWLAQRGRGFELRHVPFVDGGPSIDDLAGAVDCRTAIVAVSHVQSASGYRVDLGRLAELCRGRGARLFVDATQSVGALQVPTDGVDYLAVAGYKWLLAPRGTAFLVVAPGRALDLEPLAPGWKTPPDPYAGYYGSPYERASDASRLDVSLGWPAWVGAAEALDLLLDVGIEAIQARVLGLADRFCNGLDAAGLSPSVGPDQRSQIIALQVPAPAELRQRLAAEGVVAAVRGEYLRVAFHLFNDESDVDRVLSALTATR